jgi:1,4-alpha-glucan branching enzyme
MHDTLVYFGKEPIHRQYHHHQMTFATVYAWSENFILPISHDEVVHGKRALVSKVQGDWWQQRATVRALLAFMWSFPGKQLLFMGSEFADGREWSEERGLDWSMLDDDSHAGVARLVTDLNTVYRREAALWSQDTTPEGFEWIVGDDAQHNVFAFERVGSAGELLVCVANFSALPHENYRREFGVGKRGPEGGEHPDHAASCLGGMVAVLLRHSRRAPAHAQPGQCLGDRRLHSRRRRCLRGLNRGGEQRLRTGLHDRRHRSSPLHGVEIVASPGIRRPKRAGWRADK